MKKVLFLLLIFFVITSNVFSLQQNLQYQEESLSFSISPATFLTILPWQDEDGNSTPMPFFGVSVNLGSSNVEHDWFLSLYPSEVSFGYERRTLLLLSSWRIVPAVSLRESSSKLNSLYKGKCMVDGQ